MVPEGKKKSNEETSSLARDCETLKEMLVHESSPTKEPERKESYIILTKHRGEPEHGAHYEHYKRKDHYTVLGVGVQIPEGERVVVYQGEYDSLAFGKDPRWVRRLSSFLENVTQDGMLVARFRKLSIP